VIFARPVPPARAQAKAHWDPQFQMLVDPRGRHLPVSWQLTDFIAREPVRLHLDLYSDTQAEQIERLLELGAARVDDWPYPTTPTLLF
jgi:glyoxalase superfamily protein